MSTHKPHFGLVKRVLTYNSAGWPCDNCGATPENLVIIMRGGYVQEQLCPDCDKKQREVENDG